MKFRQKALKEMKDRRSWKGHLDRRSWKKLKCVQRWPSPQQIISWMPNKRKHKSDTKLVLIPGLATVSSNNPQLKPDVPRQYLNPQIFNTESCTKENGTEYLVTGNMQTRTGDLYTSMSSCYSTQQISVRTWHTPSRVSESHCWITMPLLIETFSYLRFHLCSLFWVNCQDVLVMADGVQPVLVLSTNIALQSLQDAVGL